MEHSKNRVLPWITLAVSLVFSIAYVIMSVCMKIDMGMNVLTIVVLATMGLSVVAIAFAIVTGAVNKIHDPVVERIDAVCARYSAFALILSVLPIAIQLLLFSVIPGFEDYAENDPARATFIMTVLTIYVIGFPVLLLTLHKVPSMKIEKRNPTVPFFIMCVAVTSGLCLAGILIGLPIEMLLTEPFEDGSAAEEADKLAEILMKSSFFDRVLVTGILAPIFEELIFRKLLVSRTIKYGETLSILLSGFMFGLFHGNFQQFFFASFVGMLFAFVFIRTGKVIYTIILHMIVNLSTSIVTTSLYIKLMPYMDDVDSLTDMPADIALLFLVLTFWIMLLGMIAITGIVLFFVFNKKFRPYKTPGEPSVGKIIGSFASSAMFWSFVIVCLGQFGSAYLPAIVNYFM